MADGLLYKNTRNWENLQIACYGTDQRYGIPMMQQCRHCDTSNWIGFNFAQSCDAEERKNHGLHFHVDDYQFQRLWADPFRYLPMLRSFGAVMSPDFSIYPDFPDAVRIYNVYRNRWLGLFWQMHGINVVPLVNWSTPPSFDFCFEGLPSDSIVSVSTIGTWNDKEQIRLFFLGWDEMHKRISPKKVIVHGPILDGMTGDLERIETFQEKMQRRIEGRVSKDGKNKRVEHDQAQLRY